MAGEKQTGELAELFHELIVATRILANQKVLDAFGHVSVRHPQNPGRYFISPHQAPELAETVDLLEMDLESQPVRPTEFRMYSERVIHGEIYKARPDVNAVCHHHSHDVLPFCISGRELVPVFHLPAVIGHVPFWDQRDEFGDTNMLVVRPEEGASLARALGKRWIVLMMRHGVTVAGSSVRDCVFRSVYSARNAEYQVRAMTLGSSIATLSAGETKLAGEITGKTTGLTRSWEYWSMRVANKTASPAPVAKKATPVSAKAKRVRTKAKPKRTLKRRR